MTRQPPLLLAGLLTIALVGSSVGLAHAHTLDGAVVTLAGSADAVGVPAAMALLVAGGLAALLVAARRRRAVLPVVLALVLSVLSFESGRHAVHHLGQTPCSVASALSHLAGAAHAPVVVETSPGLGWMPLAPDSPSVCPTRVLAPYAGRGPPLLAV